MDLSQKTIRTTRASTTTTTTMTTRSTGTTMSNMFTNNIINVVFLTNSFFLKLMWLCMKDIFQSREKLFMCSPYNGSPNNDPNNFEYYLTPLAAI